MSVETNPVLEAIRRRSSIRAYHSKPVPAEMIDTVIEAGNLAPSRGRESEDGSGFEFQPWRFVVATDPDFRRTLLETTLPIWQGFMESMKEAHPEMYQYVMGTYEAMEEPKDLIYYRAPAVLFVIGPKGFDISCALACENIMIAATSLGLGTCYVGFGAMVTGNPEVVQALELKEGERIYGPILLGFPDEGPDAMAGFRAEKKPPVVKWI